MKRDNLNERAATSGWRVGVAVVMLLLTVAGKDFSS